MKLGLMPSLNTVKSLGKDAFRLIEKRVTVSNFITYSRYGWYLL